MHDAGMILQSDFLNHEDHEGKDTKHTKRNAENDDIKKMLLKVISAFKLLRVSDILCK
jgi:hypothetical protein